jgi:hypothetical protein
MNFLGKYLAIVVLLGIGITVLLQNQQYILPTMNLEEGLTVSTPAPQKPGLYTMTNTTYDTNGNIIVKTIDTSGNFNVNTYGSSVLNTKTDQQAKYQQSTVNANTPNYQTQFYPPVSNGTSTGSTTTSDDINNMVTMAVKKVISDSIKNA